MVNKKQLLKVFFSNGHNFQQKWNSKRRSKVQKRKMNQIDRPVQSQVHMGRGGGGLVRFLPIFLEGGPYPCFLDQIIIGSTALHFIYKFSKICLGGPISYPPNDTLCAFIRSMLEKNNWLWQVKHKMWNADSKFSETIMFFQELLPKYIHKLYLNLI